MKHRLRPDPITAAWVTVLGSLILLGYLYTTVDQDARQSVRTGAMTVLMQLIAIGVIGQLVNWALNERTRDKEERVHRQDALNEFRRHAIQRLVTATIAVRKAPILMKSDRSWETYDAQARALLDVRLELRSLHHDLKSVKDAFTKIPDISCEIERKMEAYLDLIVNEWRDYRPDHIILADRPEGAWEEISKLPHLADLLKGDKTTQFYHQYLNGHENALRLMRTDIFGPHGQNGSRPDLDPEKLPQYLKEINFPVEKGQVATIAEENNAPKELVQKLRSANTHRFNSREEVLQALQEPPCG
jgi:hypothetical protein